jgi:hypothetical protein
VELKYSSRLNALFPKAFQAARLLQKNFAVKQGAIGLDLENIDLKAFAEKITSGKSSIDFGADYEKLFETKISAINENPFKYDADIVLGQGVLKNSKLLLLLGTLDFLFRIEQLKVNLGASFKDPKEYWNNFHTNIIEPLRIDSLALLQKLKDNDGGFIDRLTPLISEAKVVANRWMNTLHTLGRTWCNGGSLKGNPSLLEAMNKVTGPNITDDQWTQFLKPLHSAD